MHAFNWHGLLEQWNAALLNDPEVRSDLPAEVVAAGWLGFPGASESQLSGAEERLGTTLPPSYRAFLMTTNGWRRTTPFIARLWSTEEMEWFSVRHQGWINAYAVEHDSAGLWQQLGSALEVSEQCDSAIYLLNPQAVTAEGEWEAWFFADWLPGATRYPSFQALMQAEYRSYLQLRGGGPSDPRNGAGPHLAGTDQTPPRATRRSRRKGASVGWATKPIESYLAALQHDDPRVRRQAAAALELLGDKRSVPALIATLQDLDSDVRGNAARALGRLRSKRAVRPLIAALRDSVPAVRAEAISALATLGALERVRDPAVTEGLIAALEGPPLLRYAAARALGYLGDPRAVGPLVTALRDEVSGKAATMHWGAAIAVALGLLGEPAVPSLIALLEDGDGQLREMAALALQYTKDPRAVEPLRQALQDEETMVRVYAARALQEREGHHP